MYNFTINSTSNFCGHQIVCVYILHLTYQNWRFVFIIIFVIFLATTGFSLEAGFLDDHVGSQGWLIAINLPTRSHEQLAF